MKSVLIRVKNWVTTPSYGVRTSFDTPNTEFNSQDFTIEALRAAGINPESIGSVTSPLDNDSADSRIEQLASSLFKDTSVSE